MKKYLLVFLLIVFIIPSVAFGMLGYIPSTISPCVNDSCRGEPYATDATAGDKISLVAQNLDLADKVMVEDTIIENWSLRDKYILEFFLPDNIKNDASGYASIGVYFSDGNLIAMGNLKIYLNTDTPPSSNQNTCPLNSYSSNGSCYCSAGYKLNSDKTSCIIVPIKTRTELVPTCSVSFTPQTVEIGEWVTETYKTTGIINSIVVDGTGDAKTGYRDSENYVPTFSADSTSPFVIDLNKGSSSNERKTHIVGIATQINTIMGPGGSNTCTGSYTVTPKLISVESIKNIPQKEINETTNIKIVSGSKQNENIVSLVNLESAKKVKWYQKLFNLLFK